MAITSSNIKIYSDGLCTQLVKTVDGTTEAVQNISVTGLSEHSNYWAKASATNTDSLTGTSSAYQFQTLWNEPVITVTSSNVTQTSATLTFTYTGNYPIDTSNYSDVHATFGVDGQSGTDVQFGVLQNGTPEVLNLTNLAPNTTYYADFAVDYYDGEVTDYITFTTATPSYCNCTFDSNNVFIRSSHNFSFSFNLQNYPATQRIQYWWGTDPNFSTNTGTKTQTNHTTNQTYIYNATTYLPTAGNTLYQKVRVTLADGAVFEFTNSVVCPVVNWDVNSTYTTSGNNLTFTATTSNPAQSNNVYKVKDNWLMYKHTGGNPIDTSKVAALRPVTITLEPNDYTVTHYTEDYWGNVHQYVYPQFAVMNPYIADIVSSGSTATFDLQFYPSMTITFAALEWTNGTDSGTQRVNPADSSSWVIQNLPEGQYTVTLSVSDGKNTYKSSENIFKIEKT